MSMPIDSRVSISNSCNDMTCCCCLWPKKNPNAEPKITRSERKKMEADAKAFEAAKKAEIIAKRTGETYD